MIHIKKSSKCRCLTRTHSYNNKTKINQFMRLTDCFTCDFIKVNVLFDLLPFAPIRYKPYRDLKPTNGLCLDTAVKYIWTYLRVV